MFDEAREELFHAAEESGASEMTEEEVRTEIKRMRAERGKRAIHD